MPVTFPSSEGQPEMPDDYRSEQIEGLLEGGVDLHVHPFPSPFPRRMGILEAARDASAAALPRLHRQVPPPLDGSGHPGAA